MGLIPGLGRPPLDKEMAPHYSILAWGIPWVEEPEGLQCLTLCNSMNCSLPGSSVHGLLQARILEQVAISYSRGTFLFQGSNPSLLHLQHRQVDSLPLHCLGRPMLEFVVVVQLLSHARLFVAP